MRVFLSKDFASNSQSFGGRKKGKKKAGDSLLKVLEKEEERKKERRKEEIRTGRTSSDLKDRKTHPKKKIGSRFLGFGEEQSRRRKKKLLKRELWRSYV